MRIQWLSCALILSALLALLEFLAVANYLFWRYTWFDIPMHFLGGATIAVFLVALLMHFRPRVFLLGMFVVAIGWEIFEYLFGFPREANYYFDTALDLLMDTLGGVVVYIVARLTVWR